MEIGQFVNVSLPDDRAETCPHIETIGKVVAVSEGGTVWLDIPPGLFNITRVPSLPECVREMTLEELEEYRYHCEGKNFEGVVDQIFAHPDYDGAPEE